MFFHANSEPHSTEIDNISIAMHHIYSPIGLQLQDEDRSDEEDSSFSAEAVGLHLHISNLYDIPSPWFRDEGGQLNQLEIKVCLLDSMKKKVVSPYDRVRLKCTLCYEGGEIVPDQNHLVITNDDDLFLKRNGETIIQCRINDVSRNHGKKKFVVEVSIDPHYAQPNLRIVQNQWTNGIDVRSKISKKNREKRLLKLLEKQAAAQVNQQTCKPPITPPPSVTGRKRKLSMENTIGNISPTILPASADRSISPEYVAKCMTTVLNQHAGLSDVDSMLTTMKSTVEELIRKRQCHHPLVEEDANKRYSDRQGQMSTDEESESEDDTLNWQNKNENCSDGLRRQHSLELLPSDLEDFINDSSAIQQWGNLCPNILF